MPGPSVVETVAPRMPSRPSQALPAGACDAHAHVFGPYDRFPFAGPSNYPPPLALLDVYLEMLDKIGADRGVLVQPAPYETDTGALTDALRRAGGRARGIGVATEQVSDTALAVMHEAGVRGLRFVEMRDPYSGGRYKGCVGVDQLKKLATRMAAFGWHAQLWARCADLAALLPGLIGLPVPLVLDHMACFDLARGVTDPDFEALIALLREGRIWVKLSVCRNSKAYPDYEDARPFHDALIRANPDRLLWGSDWPFVRMGDLAPDVGHLLDIFHAWVGDAELRRKILVDNPAALYEF